VSISIQDWFRGAQPLIQEMMDRHTHLQTPISNESTFTIGSTSVTVPYVDDGRVIIVDESSDYEAKSMRPEHKEPEPTLREVWAD